SASPGSSPARSTASARATRSPLRSSAPPSSAPPSSPAISPPAARRASTRWSRCGPNESVEKELEANLEVVGVPRQAVPLADAVAVRPHDPVSLRQVPAHDRRNSKELATPDRAAVDVDVGGVQDELPGAETPVEDRLLRHRRREEGLLAVV